jgi:hypothetical protein
MLACLLPPTLATVEPVPDDWRPSIETAYQRYIHHARGWDAAEAPALGVDL